MGGIGSFSENGERRSPAGQPGRFFPLTRALILIGVFLGTAGLLHPISFEEWSQIHERINSNDKGGRLWAIEQVRKNVNETGLDLVRERLVVETEPEVQDALLKLFEERKSKDDFFHLVDFLRVVSDRGRAVRTVTLLHTIHAPRLRYELGRIFARNGGALAAIYLSAFPKPDEKDRDWWRKENRTSDLSRDWLLYRDEEEKAVTAAWLNYFSEEEENPSAASIYWTLLSCKAAGRQPAPALKNHIKASFTRSFPGPALLKALWLQNAFAPETILWEKLDEILVVKASLGIGPFHGAALNAPAAKTRLGEIISSSNSGAVLLHLMLLRERLPSEFQTVFRDRCARGKVSPEFCFRGDDFNREETWKIYKAAEKPVQQRIRSLHLGSMLHAKTFQRNEFLSSLLGSADAAERRRAAILMPVEIYSRFPLIIATFYLTEPDKGVRALHRSRIFTRNDLVTLYAPFFRTDEKIPWDIPEKAAKKKDAADNKGNDQIETGTPH